METTDYIHFEETSRKVSYSQYSTWSTCPHSWKLKYVDKLREPTNIHLIFGTAIHSTIQEWLTKVYENSKKAKYFDLSSRLQEHLITLFKEGTTEVEGVKKYPCTKEDLKEFYADGVAILDHVYRYRKAFFPPDSELIGCEIPLSVPLSKNVSFVGYIDIVIKHKDGTIVIIDFKTSKNGWFYEKKDPKKLNQILLYKKFYAEVFEVDEDDIVVQFIILKRKVKPHPDFPVKHISKFEPANGKISVKKAAAAFNNFVTTTFDESGNVLLENLSPTPSKQNCRFCQFRSQKDLCSVGIE
jgi:Holliday junction resolvase-like predicted endonuclease